MVNVKTTRKVDEQGRVAIPKEIREALSIEPEDKVTFTLSEGIVTIYKVTDEICMFCGEKAYNSYKGKPICGKCIARLINDYK